MDLRNNAVQVIDSGRPKQAKLDKKLERLKLSDEKFLANFDPETSVRETRKMQKKLTTKRKKTRSSARYGQLPFDPEKDLCDCIDVKCSGCFDTCIKCESNKCGNECHVTRKTFAFERSIEGTLFKITLPKK